MNKLFGPAPEPPTPLGVVRILGKLSGLRVSPLCIGGMSFGDAWSEFMGSMSKQATFDLLDAFYEAGGNFIDTSNNYQFGQSEEWIGEWMEKRGNRDEIVLATKYTTGFNETLKIRANTTGNHLKSMHTSVEASLKKLRTSYIDILYVHWWDYTTSVEEMMQGLNNFVRAGKVLYLGASDCPAWVVADANRYAKEHALSQFVIYQGAWSLIYRDLEREIVPYCRQHGLAIAPYNSIGGGRFQTKKDLEKRKSEGEGLRTVRGGPEQSPLEAKASEALEKVAKELGTESITAVALAYIMQKVPYVFPIVGGRKVEHLKSNIEALTLRLSPEQIQTLESVQPFDVGFPASYFGTNPHTNGGVTLPIQGHNAKFAWVTAEEPIRPPAKN